MKNSEKDPKSAKSGKSSGKQAKRELKKKDDDGKKKKNDDRWTPVIVISAVVIIMIILIILSFKSGETHKKFRQKYVCLQQLQSRVGPIVAAYHRENGKYPDNLATLKDYIKEPQEKVDKDKAGVRADIEKRVIDIWRNFYCEADTDKQSFSYVYDKPVDNASEDYIVLHCRIHKDKVYLRLKDMKEIENNLPK